MSRKKRNGARRSARKAEFELVPFTEVEPTPRQWLWQDRLPIGLVLLVGDPATGKSSLATDWAARITAGQNWPDESPNTAGSVLVLSAEEDPSSTMIPRFAAAGGLQERAHFLRSADGRPLSLQHKRDRGWLERHVRRLGDVRLIVLDPIADYLPGINIASEAEVRPVLVWLKTMAERWNLTILALRHMSKSETRNALYRLSGSIAFAAVPRAVYVTARDEAAATGDFAMAAVKFSLGPKPYTISYRFHSPVSDVTAPNTIEYAQFDLRTTVEELIGNRRGRDRLVDKATHWLRQTLSAGPVSFSSITHNVANEEFSMRTVERAATILNVRRYKPKLSHSWSWELPSPNGKLPKVDVSK